MTLALQVAAFRPTGEGSLISMIITRLRKLYLDSEKLYLFWITINFYVKSLVDVLS